MSGLISDVPVGGSGNCSDSIGATAKSVASLEPSGCIGGNAAIPYLDFEGSVCWLNIGGHGAFSETLGAGFQSAGFSAGAYAGPIWTIGASCPLDLAGESWYGGISGGDGGYVDFTGSAGLRTKRPDCRRRPSRPRRRWRVGVLLRKESNLGAAGILGAIALAATLGATVTSFILYRRDLRVWQSEMSLGVSEDSEVADLPEVLGRLTWPGGGTLHGWRFSAAGRCDVMRSGLRFTFVSRLLGSLPFVGQPILYVPAADVTTVERFPRHSASLTAHPEALYIVWGSGPRSLTFFAAEEQIDTLENRLLPRSQSGAAGPGVGSPCLGHGIPWAELAAVLQRSGFPRLRPFSHGEPPHVMALVDDRRILVPKRVNASDATSLWHAAREAHKTAARVAKRLNRTPENRMRDAPAEAWLVAIVKGAADTVVEYPTEVTNCGIVLVRDTGGALMLAGELHPPRDAIVLRPEFSPPFPFSWRRDIWVLVGIVGAIISLLLTRRR